MSNGSFVAFQKVNNPCSGNTCGIIFFDVNGLKGPNVLGRDIFYINFNNIKINLPANYKLQPETCAPTLSNNQESGKGCLSRILAEDAMNY